jgi:HAD superfamily hydrolase (TIGR01490 family)
MKLALFDMDRTLLSRETGTLYVRYQRRIGEASTRDLLRTSWWVLKYTLGVLDMNAVAERAIVSLVGLPEEAMRARCETWFQSDVEKFIAEGGRRAVREHLERGDVCAIVTGASRYASQPLAKRLAIPHVVSTEFEVDAEGRFTGKIVQPLCVGEGKLARAERFAEQVGLRIEDATFYTDSVSDLPLLARVRQPVAVNPDPRLGRLAAARGWRCERWY